MQAVQANQFEALAQADGADTTEAAKAAPAESDAGKQQAAADKLQADESAKALADQQEAERKQKAADDEAATAKVQSCSICCHCYMRQTAATASVLRLMLTLIVCLAFETC